MRKRKIEQCIGKLEDARINYKLINNIDYVIEFLREELRKNEFANKLRAATREITMGNKNKVGSF